AFDKAAKMLGLGWPGGPFVEQEAANSQNPNRFTLPRPLLGRREKHICNFSFSGLKTALRHLVKKQNGVNAEDVADLCAAFQLAVGDVLADRVKNAMQIFADKYPQANNLVIAGGVAANLHIRTKLEK